MVEVAYKDDDRNEEHRFVPLLAERRHDLAELLGLRIRSFRKNGVEEEELCRFLVVRGHNGGDMDNLGNWRHICVDAQRMFSEDTPWHVPWMSRVLPQLQDLSERHAARTIFTRFIPPSRPDEAVGSWHDYYRKWWMMTGEHLPQELLGLAPSLQALVPPARTFDKVTYSPWVDGRLFLMLRRMGVDTVVITGGETDVCVLATVLGAIDLGFRVLMLSDAVCSGADETHDAAVDLLGERFSVQLKLHKTEEFLSAVPV